ncbi:hypothetical protein [Azospirillum ramasamyi]|uniref:Tyr recombinase domain-containing protein n=1 Tax=Azospirillum ramasamyi TaxID=682998 RepID=A0A2U9SGE0_9PROT|nr:hypothetical protein [Azospirillum ramasamyi]AWU98091.1 hypothetical protein DM194_27790 [Azospirillum ramasamyi]
MTLATARTFRDLLDAVAADPALTAKQRKDRSGNLTVFARWLGLAPEAIPVDLAAVEDRLATLNPKGLSKTGRDLSPARVTRVKTSVRRCLEEYAGLAPPPVQPLSSGWQDLLDRVPLFERRAGDLHQGRLSALLRALDAASVRPDTVTVADLEAALERLRHASLPDPRHRAKKARQLRAAWTRATGEIVGWPTLPWPKPERAPCLALPLESFPASFQDDVAQYVASRGLRPTVPITATMTRLERLRATRSALSVTTGCPTAPGPTGTAGGGRDLRGIKERRPLADTTVTGHVMIVRRAAGALIRSGEMALSDIRRIADVATIEVTAMLLDESLGQDRPSTDSWRSIVSVLRSIAVRWRPDIAADELAEFSRLTRELKTTQDDEITPGVLAKLLRIPPPVLSRILSWPAAVTEEVRTASHGGRRPVLRSLARKSAAAIAIEILGTLPVRRRTLSLTHLEHSVVWHRDGSAVLQYRADETKTQQPVATDLAPEQVKMLRLHERVCLPVLRPVGTTERWLFPGADNRPMSPSVFARLVTDELWCATGVRINLHLMRHLLAMLLLEKNPEHNGTLVNALLGQKPGSPVGRKYAPFRSRWAAAVVRRIINEDVRPLVKKRSTASIRAAARRLQLRA